MKKGFCEIQINKLVRAAWNYKEDNKELAAKLKNNIERNGQIENIIVREINDEIFEVVNGNHRLDVLQNMNVEKVFCYNLGKITETQAKRIAIETNETRFVSNQELLDDIMKELLSEIEIDDLKLTIPFDIEQMYLSESNNDEKIEQNSEVKNMNYAILIEFDNEDSARIMSDELEERGFKCKVLIS